MKRFLTVLLTAGLVALPRIAAAATDSIAVTDHQIVGFGNQVDPTPKSIMVTLDVVYTLGSKSNAVLRLAIDREVEMNFVVVKEQPVTFGKKKQKAQVRFVLDGFNRDMLRGIVLLADPVAGEQTKSLAMTGFSLDVKRFKNG